MILDIKNNLKKFKNFENFLKLLINIMPNKKN